MAARTVMFVIATIILSACSSRSPESRTNTGRDMISSPVGPSNNDCELRLSPRLDAFVAAYNSGDVQSAVGFFSQPKFVWYSDSDRRIGESAGDRGSLEGYFRERHSEGDRFVNLVVLSAEYESERHLIHFSGRLERPSGDFPFKGAMGCDGALFEVWSIGAAQPDE